MKYLVDTDWTIDALNGQPAALAALDEHRNEGLAVSVITLGEVYEGAYINPNPEEHIASFHKFLAMFTVLALTDASMQHFARTRAELRKQGNLVSDLDLLDKSAG